VIYLVAAGTAVVLAVLLRCAIPSLPPRVDLSYPRLLLSVWEVVRGLHHVLDRTDPPAQRPAVLLPAFVTSNFIGGAIGSAAASLLWSAGGWTAVTLTGTGLSCMALAIWAAGRRGPLTPPIRP
jgi:hypothetical protein